MNLFQKILKFVGSGDTFVGEDGRSYCKYCERHGEHTDDCLVGPARDLVNRWDGENIILVSRTWWCQDYAPVREPPQHTLMGKFSLEWARKYLAQEFPGEKVIGETTANHKENKGVEFFIDDPKSNYRVGIDFTVVPLKEK